MVKIPDSDQDSKLIVLDSSLCQAPQFSASNNGSMVTEFKHYADK